MPITYDPKKMKLVRDFSNDPNYALNNKDWFNPNKHDVRGLYLYDGREKFALFNRVGLRPVTDNLYDEMISKPIATITHTERAKS